MTIAHLIARFGARNRSFSAVASLAFAGLVLSNLHAFAQIYANDRSTSLGIPLVVAVALATIFVAPTKVDLRSRRAVVAIGLVGLLAYGFERRDRAPIADSYRDAAGEHGRSPSIADLILEMPGATLLTDGTQGGMAAVLRPDLDVRNVPLDADPCDVARRVRANVVLLHGDPAIATASTAGCARRVTAVGAVTIEPLR